MAQLNQCKHLQGLSSDQAVYDHYKPLSVKDDEKVIVFMHGLPGAITKNNDCAHYYSEKHNVNTVVYHYKGLGVSKGVFSLQSSAREVEEFISYLKREYSFKNIILVCHSYSSITCLPVLESDNYVNKVVLLAPVMKVLSQDAAYSLLFEVSQALGSRGVIDVDSSIENYRSFISRNNPIKIIESLSSIKELVAIVPMEDKVVDPLEVLSREKFFKKIIKLKDDHWFSDRKLLCDMLSEVV